MGAPQRKVHQPVGEWARGKFRAWFVAPSVPQSLTDKVGAIDGRQQAIECRRRQTLSCPDVAVSMGMESVAGEAHESPEFRCASATIEQRFAVGQDLGLVVDEHVEDGAVRRREDEPAYRGSWYEVEGNSDGAADGVDSINVEVLTK